MMVSCFVCTKGWAVQMLFIQNQQLSQQLNYTHTLHLVTTLNEEAQQLPVPESG